MVTRRSPRQLIKEAYQIARDHGMHVVEKSSGGTTDFIVYRDLPGGRDLRLGKRSSPEGLRRFVAGLAGFH